MFIRSVVINYMYRSGTEEEYTELQQLLDDIVSYTEAFDLLAQKEEEQKVTQKKEERKKGEEMRQAAMMSMSGNYYTGINNTELHSTV